MDKKEVDKIVQDARRDYEGANLSRVGLIDIIAGGRMAKTELEQQLDDAQEKLKKAAKANEVFDEIYAGLKEDIKKLRVAAINNEDDLSRMNSETMIPSNQAILRDALLVSRRAIKTGVSKDEDKGGDTEA